MVVAAAAGRITVWEQHPDDLLVTIFSSILQRQGALVLWVGHWQQQLDYFKVTVFGSHLQRPRVVRRWVGHRQQ